MVFRRSRNSRTKERKRLPFIVYAGAFEALVLAGILVSAYLVFSHYRVYTDIFYSSFCAINQAINCDTVSESPYSIFLNVPVPLWGLLGYLLLALLTPLAFFRNARRERMWAFFLGISIAFCIISLVLAYVSSYKIRSYCLMCIVSYIVNFLLLLTSIVIRDRYGARGFLRNFKLDFAFLWQSRGKAAVLILPFMAGATLLLTTMPRYWKPVSLTIPPSVHRGVTENEHPWMGAEKPVVEITEFADYMCFQCWKMHRFLRALVNKYPNKVRVVHVHYPMDQEVNPIVTEPFHGGAGVMAAMAIYAMAKDKFWEMNDYLYFQWREHHEIESRKAAEALELDPIQLANANINPYVRERLLKLNIRYGMKLRIMGTPSFLIDGKVYQGTFPFEKIEAILKD